MSQNIYMSTDSIQTLISVKKTLEIMEVYIKSINEKENSMSSMSSSLTKAIVDARQKMVQVLKAECKHDYTEDDFDIGPETCKRVTYCNLCESTF